MGSGEGCQGAEGQQSHASNPCLPAQSQAWQWASGARYSTSNGLAGNGAQGGTCGVLTHLSGECPDSTSTSRAWSLLASPLPSPLGLVPSGGAAAGRAGALAVSEPHQPPAPPSGRLHRVVQHRLCPEASLHLQVHPLTMSTALGPWQGHASAMLLPCYLCCSSPQPLKINVNERSMQVLCQLGAAGRPWAGTGEREAGAAVGLQVSPSFWALQCCHC